MQAELSINSLHARGVRPDPSSFAESLRRCAKTKSLLPGRCIHARIIADEFDKGDGLLSKLLIELYGCCGCADDAYKVFDDVQHKDLLCWTNIISAYAHVGHIKQVFTLLQRMLLQPMLPDDVVLVIVLNACVRATALLYGMLVHSHIIYNNPSFSIPTINALITMYGMCGSLNSARAVFFAAQEKNVVSWTALISAFVKQGQATEALDLLKEMLTEGVEPDRVTFISILDACASLVASEMGKLVYSLVVEMGLQIDIVVGIAILNMYGKCGCLHCARFLFHAFLGHSVVAWNAMIAAYVHSQLFNEALRLFHQMQKAGVQATDVTFVSTLNACTRPENLADGMLLHHFLVDSGIQVHSDVIVGTSLLSMYSECGSLDDTLNVFESLQKRNVVSWTVLISAHVKHEKHNQAFFLFSKFLQRGIKPNFVTFLAVLDACADSKDSTLGDLAFSMIIEDGLKMDAFLKTSLVTMYGKFGKLEEAKMLFDSESSKNVVLYTAMIEAYAQFNYEKDALLLFAQMSQEGLKPDVYMYSGLLDAIGGLATSVNGKVLHSLIIETGMESVCLGIALLNMYRSCGTLNDVVFVFMGIHARNIVAFNAMLASYAENQEGEAALRLFRRIQNEGFSPDHVTFISTLDACAGSIDLVQAKSLHINIIEVGVFPDILVKTAVLNMYGKCGDFSRAEDVFESLPVRDVTAWNAMLAALSDHGRGREAVGLFESMWKDKVNPNEITIASVLSACGRAGLTKIGGYYLDSMSELYGIQPTVEHYACMADAFSRAGLLNEAENLLRKMPTHPSTVAWLALLSACKAHGDVMRAKRAADRIFELDPKHHGTHMMLSNIYLSAGMWDAAANVIDEIT